MNTQVLMSQADKIAENSLLKLVGRVGMAASLPILLVGMSWLGNTLWSLNAEQAKLGGRIDVLAGLMTERTADRYTQQDARRDLQLLESRNAEQDRRLVETQSLMKEVFQRLRDVEIMVRMPVSPPQTAPPSRR